MSTESVRVEELWTYPVKSLQGILHASAKITDAGFEHDRTFMLVDEQDKFLTQRTRPELAQFITETTDDMLRITAPDGSTLEHPLEGVEGKHVDTEVHKKPCTGVDQGENPAEFFSDALRGPVRLLRASEGSSARHIKDVYQRDQAGSRVDFADGFPYLLTSRASLDELRRVLGLDYGAVPMNRFRPNIVVDAPTLEPFEEDAWGVLSRGGLEFQVARACARCVMPSIIQSGEGTGTKGDVNVLKDLLASRKGIDLADPGKSNGRFFGQNLIHSLSSVGLTLSIGDKLEVHSAENPNIQLA